MIKIERIGIVIITYILVVFFIVLFSTKEKVIEDTSFNEKYIKIEKIPDTSHHYIGIDNRGNIYHINTSSEEEVILFLYDDITDNMIRSLRNSKK